VGYAKSPSAPLRRVGLATKSRTLAHSFFPRVPTTANAGIEDLREKREEINQQITDEEDEKSKVQSDLTVLSKRLTTLNDSIARKVRTRETKLPFTSARSIGRTIFCWKNARVAARRSPYHHPLHSSQVAARNDYDKTIQETEAAYLKILESSQTLLTVLKRESVGLSKKGGDL